MINTIGHRATERSLQLGILYPAPDALKVGIVDQLVPEEKVLSVAMEVMTQWLEVPGETRVPPILHAQSHFLPSWTSQGGMWGTCMYGEMGIPPSHPPSRC